MVVIYDWRWDEDWDDSVSCTSDLDYSRTPSLTPSPSPTLSNSGNASCAQVTSIPEVTHIVTFKCIGAVRNDAQQLALRETLHARKRGETIAVKIEPEPSNAWDSKAIAFKCKIGGSWQRVGYIVREALEEVHEAICNGDILWVKLAWVDFVLQWSCSGPGYYAGINIARRGDWSNVVIKCASTKAYK